MLINSLLLYLSSDGMIVAVIVDGVTITAVFVL